MSTDYKSRVPFFVFPQSAEDQREALRTNPLLQRMKARRTQYDDPHRPLYHYVNPEGGLNDPNGLCFWQGYWHLFYQGYPPDDPRQHWGHAISRDLVRWEDLPYCIYPDPEECCFSGATLVEDDRVIAMYHGTRVGNMVATSNDPLLLNWTKVAGKAVIPIRSPSDEPLPYNVFDPCIWRKGDFYYSLSAGQTNDGPGGKAVAADFLFRSEDLEHWTYLHPFIEGDRYSRVGDDGACPYFWPIGDKYILLFFSHSSGGQYLLGDYDTERDKFVVTYGEKFNFGPPGPCGVHAPSATPCEDGSVIAIFNMNPGMPADGWNQIMSLPRRLTLSELGEGVDVAPAGDLEQLRTEHVRKIRVSAAANTELVFDDICGNAIELRAKISPPCSSMIEFNVLRSSDGEERTRICLFHERGYFDRANRQHGRASFVTIDASYSSASPQARCRAPETVNVPLARGEEIDLQIFVDRSIVEVFVNSRRCVASRVYPVRDDSTGVSVRSQGQDTVISELDSWTMRSIYDH